MFRFVFNIPPAAIGPSATRALGLVQGGNLENDVSGPKATGIPSHTEVKVELHEAKKERKDQSSQWHG